MIKRSKGLYAQIHRGALDSKSSLADVLRACIVLGGQTGSTELRDWAHLELNGYADRVDDAPKYRHVAAPLLADGIQGNFRFQRKQLSVLDLPDFAQKEFNGGLMIPFGVAQLERLSSSGQSTSLQPGGLDTLVSIMNRSGRYSADFERIYFNVSPNVTNGILDSIRTKLVVLVTELRAVGVTEGDVSKSVTVDAVTHFAIHGGKRNNITINAPTALAAGSVASVSTESTTGNRDRGWGWVAGPWGVVLGVATLAGSYAAFGVPLDWPPFP